MATNYPPSLDTLTNPASTDKRTSPSHAGQHQDVNDAIEAIEALIGTNGTQTTPTGANRVLVSSSASASTWSASPTLTNLTLSGLTANSFLYSGTAGLLTTTVAPTNGQLLIGSTGAAPVRATLTAGSNITITNTAGAIEIAASIGTHNILSASHGDTTAATVVRGDIIIGSGVTPTWSRLAIGTSTTVIHGGTEPSYSAVSLTADVSGILPGANGGTASGFFAVSGPATTLKTFTFPNASATVLTTNAVVTIGQGGTNSGTALNNSRIMVSSAGAIVEAGAMTNGQLLIGSTSAAPVVAALTAGSGITITNGAGSITIASSAARYIGFFSTDWSVAARMRNYGTNDATTTLGDGGVDINATALQNAGRSVGAQAALASATIFTWGVTYISSTTTGLDDPSWVGFVQDVDLTISDTAITYTSVKEVGIKHIGDGTNVDWSATNSNATTETATEILANQAANTRKTMYIYKNGDTNITWHQEDGAALATHTTNLPGAFTILSHSLACTENTRLTVSGSSFTIQD